MAIPSSWRSRRTLVSNAAKIAMAHAAAGVLTGARADRRPMRNSLCGPLSVGAYPVRVIFVEKASGSKRDGRTELQKVISVLGEGDALVVIRLDRLGRSMRELANIAHEIDQ